MSLTTVSVALLLTALAGWWGVEWLRRRGANGWSDTVWGRVLVNAVRAGLVLVVLCAHLNVFDRTPRGVLVAMLPGIHYHETLHYYLGTRYFAEVGYSDLYRALVLADFEDDRASYVAGELIRNLATNRMAPRTVVLQSADEVRAAFSDERWRDFKRDVAVHREASGPEQWKLVLRDHGYNGTPLVTALLGSVAGQPWIPTDRFLGYAVLLDLVLIALFCAFVGICEGAALGLGVLFLTLANPLNDFSFVGASYLRYGYFLALGGALLALRQKRLALAGVLLAVSGWMRIFPLAIYGCLLLRDLAQRGWRERLLEHRRLHAAFAVATVAILAGTSLLDTPDGRNPWLAFADNLLAHSGTPGANQVFLAVPLIYSPARDRLHTARELRDDQRSAGNSEWAIETSRVRRERAWLVRGVAAVLLGLSFAALRRASRTTVVLPSLLAIFCVLPMTHYYWTVLSLLPLVLPDGSRMQGALLALFAAFALTAAGEVQSDQLDLRFALLSAQLLVFLVICCVVLWRREPPVTA